MTHLSNAYLAGFFDGEGCIGIYQSGNKNFHLRTQLVQSESALVTTMFTELHARFGGNFRGHFSPNGRSKYNLQLNGNEAVNFLEAVLPYLTLKRAQAEVAIAWHKGRPSVTRDAYGRIQSRTTEQITFDAQVADLLRILKRRDAADVLMQRQELLGVAQLLGVLCLQT